jgi:hypothetical protein
MQRYLLYLIAAALIICIWLFFGRFLYARTKIRATKREIYLLILVLGLVIAALAFTYFQTGGTFRW